MTVNNVFVLIILTVILKIEYLEYLKAQYLGLFFQFIS